MIRYITELLHKQLGIRRRDIIFTCLSFGLFFFFQNVVLNWCLQLASINYNQIVLANGKKYDVQYALLKQENDNLKTLLALKEEHPKQKIIFAKALTNIYNASTFWALCQDSAHIEQGMTVWSKDKLIGDRLIGFVLEKNGNYVKIAPITHPKAKFSAQTANETGVLVRGNGQKLEIVMHNSETVPTDTIVFYKVENTEMLLKVGMIKDRKTISVPPFAGVKWICIS